MSQCLNEFLLNRNQYIESRDFVRLDYQLSSYSVPVVGDDILYGIPDFRGVFSKGFTGHTGGGVAGPIGPPPDRYSLFVNQGIREKNLDIINLIVNGATGTSPPIPPAPRLSDAFSLFDVEYDGLYRASYNLPLAPIPLSNQSQAEMLEVYAMALLRDYHNLLLDPSDSRYVPFLSVSPSDNGSWNSAKNTFQKTIDDLNYFNKPLGNPLNAPVNSTGDITAGLLFRGTTQGDLIGPYLSQLFLYSVFPGNLYLNQNYLVGDISFNTIDLSRNFLNTKSSFLNIWNGGPGQSKGTFALRYISTIRDLSIFINKDELWQQFFVAAIFCLDRGVPTGFFTKNRKPGTSRFINLGPNDLYTLMLKAMKQAMNACWVWKWSQLRLRPEEYGYQTQLSANGFPLGFTAGYLTNPILTDISDNNNGNGYLLPLAYSLGSPTHPAYPAGHATIAGAMSTVLKAFFNGDSLIEAYTPDVSSGVYGGYSIVSGTKIQLYSNNGIIGSTAGVYLRYDDEIDKMASNCSYSRCMAGVHYRSDCDAGLQLGENVAISVLQQEVFKYQDDVCFRFRKRNGTIIDISNNSNPLPVVPSTYYFPSLGLTGSRIYFTTPIAIAPSKEPPLGVVLQVTTSVFYGPTGILGVPPDPTSNGSQNWGGGVSYQRPT
jgi:hypothetical protein